MSQALLLCLAFSAIGWSSPRKISAEKSAMGTLVRITVYAPEGASPAPALQAAFRTVEELDGRLSDFRPDSELSRLCRLAIRKPVRISGDLFQIIQAALDLTSATGGAFDITTGPLSEVWRQARARNRLPDESAVRRAISLCGADKVVLDAEARTVRLTVPGMRLDLGGIAKGFAADRALATLRRHGITRALVAVGGDIAIGDPPPGAAHWRVGVDATGEPGEGFESVLQLSNSGVSTSGDRSRHLDAGGRRYSHIVSPKTGESLVDSPAVTVVAPTAMLADGLATAISVRGLPDAADLIRGRERVTVFAFQDGREILRLSSGTAELTKRPAIGE